MLGRIVVQAIGGLRDRRLVAVIRIVRFEHDLLVVGPLGHLVRTVGNDVRGLNPCLSLIVDHVLWHREVGPGGGKKREESRRTFEGDDQRRVVRRGHAEISDVRFAVGDLLRVFDRIERRDVLRERVGIEHALPAIEEVLRGDWRAIRPGHALANVECVLRSVGVCLVALGNARNDLARLLIDADETIEDVEEDIKLVVAVADAWIHRRRLGDRQRHHLIGGQIAAKWGSR